MEALVVLVVVAVIVIFLIAAVGFGLFWLIMASRRCPDDGWSYIRCSICNRWHCPGITPEQHTCGKNNCTLNFVLCSVCTRWHCPQYCPECEGICRRKPPVPPADSGRSPASSGSIFDRCPAGHWRCSWKPGPYRNPQAGGGGGSGLNGR